MIDWLAEFMKNEQRRPNHSCSCSGDCDRERAAAFIEIVTMRDSWWYRLGRKLRLA